MALKGASPEHEGDERPDRWAMDERLTEVAERWRIEPRRDLIGTGQPASRLQVRASNVAVWSRQTATGSSSSRPRTGSRSTP